MIVINREILNELHLKVEQLEKRKAEVLAEFQRLGKVGTSFFIKRDDPKIDREERLLYAEQAKINDEGIQALMSENGEIESRIRELNLEFANGLEFLTKYERSPHVLLLNLKKEFLQLNDQISAEGKLIQSEFDRIGMLYILENLNDIMSDVPLRQYNYSIDTMQGKYLQICKALQKAISYISEEYRDGKSPKYNLYLELEEFARQIYLPLENVSREYNNLHALLENIPYGKIRFRLSKDLEANEGILFQNKLLELGFNPTQEKSTGLFSMFTLFGKNKSVFDYDRLVRVVESEKNSGKIDGSTGVVLLGILEKYKIEKPLSYSTACLLAAVGFGNTSLPRVIRYEFECLARTQNENNDRNIKGNYLNSSSVTGVDEETNLLTH